MPILPEFCQECDGVLRRGGRCPRCEQTEGLVEGSWVECPGGCGDFACEAHELHVADCACPAIEVWVDAGLWPYREPDLNSESGAALPTTLP